MLLIQVMGELEIRGLVETIQTATLLRSAWIPRKVLEIWGDFSENLKEYFFFRNNNHINDNDNNIQLNDNNYETKMEKKWEEKQLYRGFKRQINNNSHGKTWTWQWKVNLKREAENVIIAAQNNAIRTNQIKARIDKLQK